MDTTTLRVEQTTNIIDALIPKFNEFNLEFEQGFWVHEYVDFTPRYLQLFFKDLITSGHQLEHSITIDITEADFIRWTEARTPRAADYYLNLILQEVIAGCPSPTQEELDSIICTFDKDDGIFLP